MSAPSGCRHDGPAVAHFEDTPIYVGWAVNRDYYGAHEYDRGGAGYGCSSPTWSVELVSSEGMARRIVAASDKITAALAARGIPHARLKVDAVSATDLRISDYDWRRWSFMLVGV